MKDLNRVQLIGHLGHHPETKYTATGTARTTFSVATNRTCTASDEQTQTETEWHRVTAWGKLAEMCAQYLCKGARVYVEGRIHTNRWTDAETGEQRSGVEIVIHELIMLDGRGALPVEDADHQGMPAPVEGVGCRMCRW